jgi:hypothetical protein
VILNVAAGMTGDAGSAMGVAAGAEVEARAKARIRPRMTGELYDDLERTMVLFYPRIYADFSQIL